jgi:hypothetical protein
MKPTKAQRLALAEWMQETEGVRIADADIVMTAEPMEHFFREWGPPDHAEKLGDGRTPVFIWRGEGYSHWMADFAAVRASAALQRAAEESACSAGAHRLRIVLRRERRIPCSTISAPCTTRDFSLLARVGNGPETPDKTTGYRRPGLQDLTVSAGFPCSFPDKQGIRAGAGFASESRSQKLGFRGKGLAG